MHEIELNIQLDDAELIAKSLRPESCRDVSRTSVHIECRENELCLKIKGEDINALRAAINSYLRWIKCCTDVVEEVKGK